MIILSQTTDKIQVVLGGAVSTNQAQCVASWRDITATPTYTAGRSAANTNSTTDVDLIAAPAASTQRVIDFISVYNADTASVTLTIKYDANGTDYILWKGTLATGETCIYRDDAGWGKINATGDLILVGSTGANGTNGSNGALTVTETEIDFGVVPVHKKQFTITDAGISATSKIIAVQSGKAATGRDADENEMDALILNCNPGTGQFTLNAFALPGPVTGKYKVNYQFS